MPSIEDKNYARNIEKAVTALERNWNICDENKGLISAYVRRLSLNNYSRSRIYKNLLYLPRMAEQLRVPFPDATREDIEDLVIWINNLKLSDNTKSDYKVILKTFYKWIGDGEYPKCIKWLKTETRTNKKVLPEDLLTEEDVKKLIAASTEVRDRALIAMLWETGARIGELIDLSIKSFEDHKYGKKIVVDGKTGPRRLILISSVPYLQEWLIVHPRRNERDAPVWVNIGNVRKGEKMTYAAVNKMLRETAKKAGVDKPVNPHHFRHSRATYMASKFTEYQLCQWFGWVQGSRTPRVYVHLSGKDLDMDYARLYGIEDEEEERISTMAPKTCPRCGSSVEHDAHFCYKCGMALDMETAMEIEDMEDETVRAFVEMEDPEVKKAFEMVAKMYALIQKDSDVAKKLEEM